MTRVVAIGLDSVELSFVEALMDEGALPVLDGIRRSAATARLETGRPYRSEHTWTEFGTGQSAETLRYWGPVTFDPATYECLVIGAAPFRPFYALGARHPVIALDVPHSRPSLDLHGAQVIGWGAHDPQFPRCSRPAGLLAELEATHGPHPGIAVEYAGTWNQPEFLDELAAAIIEGTRRRVGVVRSLLDRVPDWQLLVLVMSEAHATGHHMWHGVDARSPLHGAPTAAAAAAHLRAIHTAMDASIGEIVASVPPDTTIAIFSVKGMTAADADVLAPALAPELLHRFTFGRALLRSWPPARRAAIPPPVVPDPGINWTGAMRNDFADGARRRIRRYVRTRHPTIFELARRGASRPPAAAGRVREQGPILDHVAVEDLAPTPEAFGEWHAATWYRRYWPRMAAFVLPSFSDLHIRINVAGRERDGRVPLDRYDSACDHVESLLRACVNPRTDRPIIGHVTRMRDADPMAPDGPGADLVVECPEPTDVLAHPQVGIIGPFPYLRSGTHTSAGFGWFRGPGIPPVDLGTQPASSLAATLLELLGAPGAHPGDGRSMLPSWHR